METLSIAIPCFNCRNQLLRMLVELDKAMSSIAVDYHVLILDNGSSDGTPEAARDLLEKLPIGLRTTIAKNDRNFGLGGSQKIAFIHALSQKFEHLIILHGDHQADPHDIPRLLKESQSAGGVTILGSRFQDRSLLKGYSRIRTLGNLALNALYSVSVRRVISDLGSGLNLFRLRDFNIEQVLECDSGFTFNMDLLLRIHSSRIPYLYRPIHWSTTDQISNARAIRVGFKTLESLVRWSFKIKPASPINSTSHNYSAKIFYPKPGVLTLLG